jgi:hypothetical protein
MKLILRKGGEKRMRDRDETRELRLNIGRADIEVVGE